MNVYRLAGLGCARRLDQALSLMKSEHCLIKWQAAKVKRVPAFLRKVRHGMFIPHFDHVVGHHTHPACQQAGVARVIAAKLLGTVGPRTLWVNPADRDTRAAYMAVGARSQS